MAKLKRPHPGTAQEALSPPTSLPSNHAIAKVVKGEGKNVWSVELSNGCGVILVELQARFRSSIWLKKGGFVVVDRSMFQDRDNKLEGEIVNVILDLKSWRKQTYWPAGFGDAHYSLQSEEEDSVKGKMPPSDDSDPET